MRAVAALSFLLAAGAVEASAPILVEGAPNTRPILLGDDGPACAPGGRQAVRVEVVGLRSRGGYLRAELYPATSEDFLKPDLLLEYEGKPFRRVWIAVPASAPAVLCLKAPAAGDYALSVVHLDEKRWKFNFRRDGAGFSNNPKIGMGKPPVEKVAFPISGGVVVQRVQMNYLQGLSFRPLRREAAQVAEAN